MIKLCAFADEADRTLNGQIAALTKNNIGLLEFRNVEGKNVKDITSKSAKLYKKMLADNGIDVYSIGSPIGKVDIEIDFNGYKDIIKHLFEVAKILQTKKIRVFSFFNAYDKPEKVFEYLTFIVKMGESYDIDVCHENEKEVYGDILDRVLELYNNVKGLKLIYDPANFVQMGVDVNKALIELKDKIEYFHIKDVIKKTGELVPAGYGDGGIEDIIRCIGNEDKVLSIEPHLKTFDGYAQIDSSQMINKFTFKDNADAFDAAVCALKNILTKNNYIEKQGGFIKC